MKILVFLLVLSLGLLFEATLTTLPLVFNIFLLQYILTRQAVVFPEMFVLGIIQDAISVRAIGGSSLFFMAFIFIVTLYERKFEIQTVPFVFLSSFLGSFLFLLLLSAYSVFGQATVSALLTTTAFKIIMHFSAKQWN